LKGKESPEHIEGPPPLENPFNKKLPSSTQSVHIPKFFLPPNNRPQRPPLLCSTLLFSPFCYSYVCCVDLLLMENGLSSRLLFPLCLLGGIKPVDSCHHLSESLLKCLFLHWASSSSLSLRHHFIQTQYNWDLLAIIECKCSYKLASRNLIPKSSVSTVISSYKIHC
jgi:hypothetical protein